MNKSQAWGTFKSYLPHFCIVSFSKRPLLSFKGKEEGTLAKATLFLLFGLLFLPPFPSSAVGVVAVLNSLGSTEDENSLYL